jgi:membrane-associated protease RseP (regulator of RpoE activity)
MEEHPDPRFDAASPDPPRRRRFRIPEHPLFHLALLAATFVTTTLAGGLAFTDKGGWLKDGRFADGFPFSIPLLLILGSHEMGHYLMCRRYRLAATLPYFIPSPFLTLIGTFGALIRIKEPIRDKRQLLDVGAAGPLAGFVVALPFLLYGVPRARPIPPTTAPDTALFDYPFLVHLVQRWTGADYTSATVHEDPTFMAAWFGLLVTALNLMPIGQLDGGHVLRAVAGRRQPIVSVIVLGLAAASGFAGPTWILFAAIVAVFVGVRHPPVDNDDEPLDFGRKLVALLCVAVFLLCFTLVPVHIL